MKKFILGIIFIFIFSNSSIAYIKIGIDCASLVNQLGGLNKVDILWLENLNEKPYYDLLINTGLYVIKKEVISLIPSNEKYDINEFINSLKMRKRRIGVYPISNDSWIDVGKWSEYRDALKILS